METAILLGVTVAWNQSVYYGARWIAGGWHHYDMTLPIDALVPFVPWTVLIYFGCYLFWGVNYYLCTRQDKTERNRFFCADALSKGVCLLFFLLIPTTNIRPEIVGSTLWDGLMRLLYTVDAADNLFPSIHCLVSWFCWIGIRKNKEIPVAYRWFSLLFAVAVCISTLTTRQHVIADVIGGVLLAEICYGIAGLPRVRAGYTSVLNRIFRMFKIQ